MAPLSRKPDEMIKEKNDVRSLDAVLGKEATQDVLAARKLLQVTDTHP